MTRSRRSQALERKEGNMDPGCLFAFFILGIYWFIQSLKAAIFLLERGYPLKDIVIGFLLGPIFFYKEHFGRPYQRRKRCHSCGKDNRFDASECFNCGTMFSEE